MTENVKQPTGFIFTGRHMLAILVAFFGVIISVNMLMAYLANSTWSGILAKNTYVASQDFNKKADEAKSWAALGFKGTFEIKGEMLSYTLAGPKADIDKLTSVTAIFHRPVGDEQDFSMELPKVANGSFEAPHTLAAGQWIVDIAAIEDGKTVFHEATRIKIAEKAS